MKRLAVLAALLLAGCGSGPGPEAPGEDVTYAPTDLVLQVSSGGGLMPVAYTVVGIPELSIYGDGRVITTGPVPEIYPGPALPNLQLQHIAAADIQALVRRALASGVGSGEDLGFPNVADAPTTHISVLTAKGTRTTDAPALGIGSADGLTSRQQTARRRLEDLVNALRNLDQTLGRKKIDQPVAYVPEQIAAVAEEWRAGDGQLADPPPVDWPGATALPGPTVGNGLVHCVTTPAGPVLAAAKQANARTPWVSANAKWSVLFRPLLPQEQSCADL
jgi:hypothetical protein